MTTAVKKTNAKKPEEARKVAPQVIVKSNASRSTIDDLHRDNVGKDFVYASKSASLESLRSQGLVPVTGSNGEVLVHRARVICEDVGNVRSTEVAAQAHAANERFDEMRDPELNNSSDKTAHPKKPTS